MAQGDLSFGDDVLGDASSPQRTGFEGKTSDNRPFGDIDEDGDGDRDSVQTRRRNVVDQLNDLGHHTHD